MVLIECVSPGAAYTGLLEHSWCSSLLNRTELNRSNLFLLLSISHFMKQKLITLFFFFFVSNYLTWLCQGILCLPQIILLDSESTETFCYICDWCNRVLFSGGWGSKDKYTLWLQKLHSTCSVTRRVAVKLLVHSAMGRKEPLALRSF